MRQTFFLSTTILITKFFTEASLKMNQGAHEVVVMVCVEDDEAGEFD